MKTIRGYLLRDGISDAAHKVCSALALDPVTIRWINVPTASISETGDIRLPDVKDDAVINHRTITKYMAFVVHELLHRKYTTFGLPYPNQYVRMLANGLEDARIENLAVATELTGNIGTLLGDMIDTMAQEGLDHVSDWNDPRQFPFVLAVHCRKHATVKLPMQKRVRVIFDDARERLNDCDDSDDVRKLAILVYDKLKALEDEPPPDQDGEDDQDGQDGQDGDQDGEGDGQDGDGQDGQDSEGDGQDGDGDGDLELPPKEVTIDPDEAVNPEPELSPERGIRGGVSWSPDNLRADQWHVGKDKQWSLEL